VAVIGAGWLYYVRDTALNSIVAMAVSDIEEATFALKARDVACGPIEPEGDAGRKAVVLDPDGDSIAIIEVAGRRSLMHPARRRSTVMAR
jgi:hypothetical protein